jgi:formylglycine-generating enzyme required for sulfatase activity
MLPVNRRDVSYFTNRTFRAMRPVECVGYNEIRCSPSNRVSSADAKLHYWPGEPHPNSFLGLLRARAGIDFDLPSEAQWEFAARGGIHSKGYKYSGSDELESVGWNDFNLTRGSTHPVGTKQANELGIYDMCGNVSEWCSDWYGEYTSDAVTDPTGPLSGSEHMHRGGSWDESETDSRSTSRNVYDEEPYYINGLRLALKK